MPLFLCFLSFSNSSIGSSCVMPIDTFIIVLPKNVFVLKLVRGNFGWW